MKRTNQINAAALLTSAGMLLSSRAIAYSCVRTETAETHLLSGGSCGPHFYNIAGTDPQMVIIPTATALAAALPVCLFVFLPWMRRHVDVVLLTSIPMQSTVLALAIWLVSWRYSPFLPLNDRTWLNIDLACLGIMGGAIVIEILILVIRRGLVIFR